MRGAALAALAALLAAAPPQLRDAAAPGVMALLAEGAADPERAATREGALRGLAAAAPALGEAVGGFASELLSVVLAAARPPAGLEALVYGPARGEGLTQSIVDAACQARPSRLWRRAPLPERPARHREALRHPSPRAGAGGAVRRHDLQRRGRRRPRRRRRSRPRRPSRGLAAPRVRPPPRRRAASRPVHACTHPPGSRAADMTYGK